MYIVVLYLIKNLRDHSDYAPIMLVVLKKVLNRAMVVLIKSLK